MAVRSPTRRNRYPVNQYNSMSTGRIDRPLGPPMNDHSQRLADLRIERDETPSPSPWGRRLVLALVAVVLVLLALWWVFVHQGAPPVETAVVTTSSDAAAASVLDASGYVVARRQATVSSKVTGKIAEVLVEEGLRVREGQVLARLDDSVPRRQLDLSQAEQMAAKSSLRETEVQLAKARLDLDRERELLAAGVSSQAAVDRAQAEHDSLEAQLAAARDRVVVAERQVALARQQLEDTIIRAPFDGVAISKNAQPGEMISPTSAGGGFTRTGLSTIVDMSSLEIEVDVNESYIQRVMPDQKVSAALDAYPGWRIPCHVITTVPAADRQKATFKVRIGFDELGDPRILPDMGVKVSFQSEETASESGPVLSIPKTAVTLRDDTSVVFVLHDGRVERRAVSLGQATGERQVVLAGLRQGERVVLDPSPDLDDGEAVRTSE